MFLLTKVLSSLRSLANCYDCLKKKSRFLLRNLVITHKTFINFKNCCFVKRNLSFARKTFALSRETFCANTKFLTGTQNVCDRKQKLLKSFFPLITYSFASYPLRGCTASSFHHGNKYIYLMKFHGLPNSNIVRFAKQYKPSRIKSLLTWAWQVWAPPLLQGPGPSLLGGAAGGVADPAG